MLDYQPQFNPEFIRQARKNNAKRDEEARTVRTNLDTEHRRRIILARLIARVKRPISLPISTPRPMTYAKIERRIAKATGVTLTDIRGHRRNARIMTIRHAVAYWAARRTELSYPSIGRLMGGRDHTAIMHAVKTYPGRRGKEGKSRRKVR